MQLMGNHYNILAGVARRERKILLLIVIFASFQIAVNYTTSFLRARFVIDGTEKERDNEEHDAKE